MGQPDQLPPVSPCMQIAQISGPSIIPPQRPLCAGICLDSPLPTELEDQGIDLLGLFGADQMACLVTDVIAAVKVYHVADWLSKGMRICRNQSPTLDCEYGDLARNRCTRDGRCLRMQVRRTVTGLGRNRYSQCGKKRYQT